MIWLSGWLNFQVYWSKEMGQTQLLVSQIVPPVIPGVMVNGQIMADDPPFHSNNLTVYIKTLAGNDPSPSDPVLVRIGNTIHTISSALSVTKNAGTAWMNLSSTCLASMLTGLFVYLGYNATDGVILGFSRIPWAKSYGDFSTTNTNEGYGAFSNISHAAGTDPYELVGRFTSRMTSGNNWIGVSDIINRPIYETEWSGYDPTPTCTGSMTITSPVVTYARYIMHMKKIEFHIRATGTLAGTASYGIYVPLPFNVVYAANFDTIGTANIVDAGGSFSGVVYATDGSPDLATIVKYSYANFTLGAGFIINISGFYEAGV